MTSEPSIYLTANLPTIFSWKDRNYHSNPLHRRANFHSLDKVLPCTEPLGSCPPTQSSKRPLPPRCTWPNAVSVRNPKPQAGQKCLPLKNVGGVDEEGTFIAFSSFLRIHSSAYHHSCFLAVIASCWYNRLGFSIYLGQLSPVVFIKAERLERRRLRKAVAFAECSISRGTATEASNAPIWTRWSKLAVAYFYMSGDRGQSSCESR